MTMFGSYQELVERLHDSGVKDVIAGFVVNELRQYTQTPEDLDRLIEVMLGMTVGPLLGCRAEMGTGGEALEALAERVRQAALKCVAGSMRHLRSLPNERGGLQ